ncbi:hypothetical protein RSAG8_11708, partial [Rhizoctonia solani AG-8 WAC10335]
MTYCPTSPSGCRRVVELNNDVESYVLLLDGLDRTHARVLFSVRFDSDKVRSSRVD